MGTFTGLGWLYKDIKGITEKKMETMGIIVIIQGLYRDNKEYIRVVWGQWKRKWKLL